MYIIYISNSRRGVMKKINKVIWLETFYIAAWTLIFSMLMQAVFLVIDWDYTVLLGNLLGAFAGVFKSHQ